MNSNYKVFPSIDEDLSCSKISDCDTELTQKYDEIKQLNITYNSRIDRLQWLLVLLYTILIFIILLIIMFIMILK